MQVWKRNGFWFGVWTLLALVVLWQYDPVNYRLDDDASFMLYAGQQILRGVAPYTGVAIVKLPLSPLLAALGIGAGRLFGVDDILAGRIVFWLCAGLTVGAVYLIGAQVAQYLPFRGRSEDPKALGTWERAAGWLVGSFSAVVLLSWQVLGTQVARGPEAKLPMICAGMVWVVLIARRRFFWAGVAGALAFLAWQPGLVFVAAALLSGAVVSTRRRALFAALGGALVPLLLVGIYLGANGALGSMFRQAFGANANYLGDKKFAAGLGGVLLANVTKLREVSFECNLTEAPFLLLAMVGLVGGGVWLVWRLLRARDAQAFLDLFPLGLSGAALFGFSLLDLQKCSDVIPLMPYYALGAGGLLGGAFLLGVSVLARASSAPRHENTRALTVLYGGGALLLVILFWYGARDAFALAPQNGLAEERATAAEIEARLAPGDRVQEFGNTGFLVITRRDNATRFIHLGEKQGLGIFTAEGITLDEVVAQVRTANPRAILLSRAKNKEWAAPLYAWINENYVADAVYNASLNTRNKGLEVFWKR